MEPTPSPKPLYITMAIAALIVIAFFTTGIIKLNQMTPPAEAQSPPPAATGVSAANAGTTGQTTVSWNTVPAAGFYRVGWVSRNEITRVTAAGRDWLDAFNFTDIANTGQTSHTVRNLEPGVEYAFIIGTVTSRFTAAKWSTWAFLHTSPAPMPSPVPTQPAPTPPDTTACLTITDSHSFDGNGDEVAADAIIMRAGYYKITTTAINPSGIYGMGWTLSHLEQPDEPYPNTYRDFTGETPHGEKLVTVGSEDAGRYLMSVDTIPDNLRWRITISRIR